jgi:MoaA/NifB/PqqE/SkfB family radical SAM enzyme
MDDDFSSFSVDYSLLGRMNYDIDMLGRFCRRDPECVLTFYGGEPLLCIDEIKQIMDHVKVTG